MRVSKNFFLPRIRITFLILTCFLCFSIAPNLFASPFLSTYSLGEFKPGTIKVIYQNTTLPTYDAYGTHYVAASALRQFGLHVTYTPSPKTVNITIPSNWSTTTTPAQLEIHPSSFSFYDGTVYLQNFKTQCLISEGRLFIPVNSLSELGTLTLDGDKCVFTPGIPSPIKATDTEIINLSSVTVSISLIDFYWKDEIITYPNTFTLAPGESLDRTPPIQEDALYITTLVQEVTGNDIYYKNKSLRGQINKDLIKQYLTIQNYQVIETYGDLLSLQEITDAETFINSKSLTSPTPYLVWTNTDTQRTYIFTGNKDHWTLLKHFICSTGRDITPTPKGTFALTHKVPSFGQSKGYCCKYAFGFIGTSYLYHSIIYDKTGTYLLENKGVLGKKASQGCIRFATENAQWFYENLLTHTTVYIN